MFEKDIFLKLIKGIDPEKGVPKRIPGYELNEPRPDDTYLLMMDERDYSYEGDEGGGLGIFEVQSPYWDFDVDLEEIGVDFVDMDMEVEERETYFFMAGFEDDGVGVFQLDWF